MKKIAMAIHGCAGPDSPYIQKNIEAYRKGLETALNAGYAVLEKNGRAVDAI